MVLNVYVYMCTSIHMYMYVPDGCVTEPINQLLVMQMNNAFIAQSGTTGQQLSDWPDA